MKKIKHITVMLSCLVFFGMSTNVLANTTQMNATLHRISRILNQVNPLINLAQKQQDKNTRVKFQFDALREDIAHIQAGIAQAINRVSIQPRVVQPLSGDYLPVPNNVVKQDTQLRDEDGQP